MDGKQRTASAWKVWTENGMVMVITGENCNMENVEKITQEVKKTIRALGYKPKIFIDTSMSIPFYNILWRKRVVEILKDTYKDPGFGKVAMLGPDKTSVKVVTAFILGVLKLDNIKYFLDRSEALEWLKK